MLKKREASQRNWAMHSTPQDRQNDAELQIPSLLTTEDLARILRRSTHSIRNDLSRNPRSLPPSVVIPGGLRRLWRPQDVEAWLESLVVAPLPPVASQQRQRGAPIKAERLKKAAS